MKKILVNIWAYDHHARFTVECEDNSISLEQAIVDKLGKNAIVWEYLGISYDNKINRITYEEVINGENDATSERPLHKEEGSRSSVGARAS